MARPLRPVRGLPDDRPRHDGGQRRAARDPGGPRLQPVRPRVGRQRLPDRLRRSPAALRAPRRPPGAQGRLHGGYGDLPHRLARLRLRAEPGGPGRRAVHPGRRRRAHLGGDPGDDRDDVPGAEGAGEGARRLRVRRFGRRLDRPPGRRRPDRGHQLALDLLHQPADRHRHRDRGQQARHPRQGPRLRQGHRHPGRGPHHLRR